jgi:5-methylcytosine-specific restriction endonuclease McrA
VIPTAQLNDPLVAPVLVLNRNYLPVRLTTARNAFELMYLGRARALDTTYEPYDFHTWVKMEPQEGDELVGTSRGAIRVPRVLLLTTYNRVPRVPLRLSRRNVFLRDQYTCQYCGESRSVRDLNLDHVLPRSRGGRSTWENLVTSCRPCNLEKGGKTPEEAGKLLLRRPTRPSWSVVSQLATCPRRCAEWEPFLS